MASKNNQLHHFRTNILQVMDNLKTRAKATMLISPNGVYYILDGQQFPENVFNRIFSTDVKKLPNVKGDNLDGRSNFY
jgi:RNAse (barnase) inhibitor barstar